MKESMKKNDNNITDIIYGLGILAMLVIMVLGAVLWALGY